MTIQLYEYGPTRSQRARWTLLELDVPFESIAGRELFGSDRLRAIHPQAKLPALKDDGRPLYESAAICTWLADRHPDGELVASSGTWERALHDQWVAFTLSELEAHLWSASRNQFIYPEEMRVDAILDQNKVEATKGLSVFDDHLADNDYLVGGRFTVADIIASFATNWARRQGLTEGFDSIQRYHERLWARPHCVLNQDD